MWLMAPRMTSSADAEGDEVVDGSRAFRAANSLSTRRWDGLVTRLLLLLWRRREPVVLTSKVDSVFLLMAQTMVMSCWWWLQLTEEARVLSFASFSLCCRELNDPFFGLASFLSRGKIPFLSLSLFILFA